MFLKYIKKNKVNIYNISLFICAVGNLWAGFFHFLPCMLPLSRQQKPIFQYYVALVLEHLGLQMRCILKKRFITWDNYNYLYQKINNLSICNLT